MKAAVIVAPRKLEIRDIPKPACGDNDLVLRVHRASICASDLMYYDASFRCPPYPFILGHESSGEVVEIGRNTQGFQLGDGVTFWGGGDFGGFAEFRAIRPGPRELFRAEDGFWYDKSQAVVKLHNSVSYEEGALLEVLCSAVRTIYASDLRPGDKVAILGLGAGGLLLLQAVKALGASAIIGIDREDFRLEKAAELGADATYNNAEVDKTSIKRDIWNKFGEVDLVFDAMGNDLSREKSARNLAFELLRPHGKCAVFGTPSEDQRVNIALITSKGIQTRAATFDARYFPMDKSQDLLKLSQRLLVERMVKIKPLITHKITLDQIEEGLRLAKSRKDEAIKIVIEIE